MEAPTEESYVKRAEVSLEEFIKCDEEGGSYYRNECQGKLAVFYATVWNHYEDTGVRLGLHDGCVSQRLYKTVDVPNLDYEYSKQHNEKCVRVYAKIGPENFNTPDLQVIETIWIESDEEFSERKEAERLAEAKAEALALEANKTNAEWLANKFDAASSVYCKSAVESLAKYDYEWTDDWLESKFPGYLTVTPSPYVFTSTGDKIKFQNGFGAWQNQKYYCDYNVKTKQVVRAWVQ
jgi:hypothetical protein